MKLLVKSLSEDTLNIDLDENLKISDVKNKLWYNAEQYEFLYEGKILNGEFRLSDYNIHPNNILFKQLKLNGGKNKTENSSTVVQKTQQQINQSFTGICSFNCTSIVNNTSIVIINSNIEGDISVQATCSTDGSCTMATNMQTAVLSEMAYEGVQSGAESFFLDYASRANKTINDTNLVFEAFQNINQNIQQICSNESTAIVNGTTIYVENSNVGGGILVGSTSQVKGSCVLDSAMNAAATASGAFSLNQNGGTKAGKKGFGKNKGAIWTWVGVIAGVCVLGIIIITIFKLLT